MMKMCKLHLPHAYHYYELSYITYTDEGFGAVKYIEAKLCDKINGAIVFPAKTTHEENYLEFIA